MKLQLLEVNVDRHFAIDGGQFFGKQRTIAVLFEVLAQLSLEFPHVRQQILDAAVLADEFAGGLFANAGDTRDVVRHIAPQADDVDHLFGPFHTPLRANFRKTKDFGGVAFPTHLLQTQDGFPSLDLSITAVTANPAFTLDAPENVKSFTPPAVKVDSQKLGAGVTRQDSKPCFSARRTSVPMMSSAS